jgi:hypothetical protein
MRDDYIQGILFSRSDRIDLRIMSRSERNMYKMLTTKNTLRDWSTRPMQRSSVTAAAPGTIITPRVQG